MIYELFELSTPTYVNGASSAVLYSLLLVFNFGFHGKHVPVSELIQQAALASAAGVQDSAL